jgi:4-hydroxybutyryl-CoA dehydratase/vinylacetyl-CoA-Delta-isomerase
MKPNLYFNGEKIGRDHEMVAPSLNVMGRTFEAAQDPELEELCTATSHITGEKINRFCHVHQNPDDLHKKQDMTRALCTGVGYCIQRCMGVDALNAVNAVSFEADKVNKGETNYHANFLKWLERFQKEDLVATCAQTDVKGERMKRPIEQTDPDAYVHVVERREDGIVVRGCKVHITQAATADEIIVVPTRALGPDEGDYAVAFAIPGDWEGVKQVIHVHNPRERKEYKRGFDPGYIDSYVIFDDVFVPWERVFLCGETQHGGICALLFALFHRHSYSGCKPAVGDLIMGLAATAAEVNCIETAGHVREKMSELITIAELGYAAGYTASAKGKAEIYMPGYGNVPYGPGSCIPNSIYANVGRCMTGEAVFHEQEILCDIAGGMPATFPYEEDLLNEEIKPFLDKYLKRNPDMEVEDQIKFWLYFGELTCSAYSGSLTYGGFHGGGSPVMEQIAITSQYDIKKRKNYIKKLAGMKVPEKKRKG